MRTLIDLSWPLPVEAAIDEDFKDWMKKLGNVT